MMKSTLTVGCFFSLAVGAVLAQSRPAEYPRVALAANATPHYVALGMDAWEEKVAYVCFDGNLQDGYKRAYVWIPNDPKYGTPVALTSNEAGVFDTFGLQTVRGDETSMVQWRIQWRRKSGGARQVSRHDYVTGKSAVTTVTDRETIEFHYQVAYGLGRRTDVSGGHLPLSLSRSHWLGVQDKWTNIGAALRPWNHITFALGIKKVRGPERGELVITPAFPGTTVHSLPDDAEIELAVMPYLEDPLYEETLNAADMLRNGVSVEVPYGWYLYRARLKCKGTGGQMNTHPSVPFPFEKPMAP